MDPRQQYQPIGYRCGENRVWRQFPNGRRACVEKYPGYHLPGQPRVSSISEEEEANEPSEEADYLHSSYGGHLGFQNSRYGKRRLYDLSYYGANDGTGAQTAPPIQATAQAVRSSNVGQALSSGFAGQTAMLEQYMGPQWYNKTRGMLEAAKARRQSQSSQSNQPVRSSFRGISSSMAQALDRQTAKFAEVAAQTRQAQSSLPSRYY